MGNQKKIRRLNVDMQEDIFLRLKVACAFAGKSMTDIAKSAIARELRSLEKRNSERSGTQDVQVQP